MAFTYFSKKQTDNHKTMTTLQKNIRQMEPATALAEIAQVLEELLSHQDEEKRVEFLQNILGNTEESKVGSMVNL